MAIFHEYLKISLWIIPVILLALWLLPKLSQKYSAKLSYFVWLVIAVRLLIPWNMTLPAETAPIQLDIPQESILEWTPVENPAENMVIHTGNEINADNYVFVEPEIKEEVRKDFTVSPRQIILLLWIIGSMATVLYPIIATVQLKKLIKRWEKQPSEPTVEVYKKISSDRKPPIAVCSVLATPMAVGLVHTKIYLPHEEYSEHELEMILKHELIHWERKDLCYKFLLLLTRGIHWFNPFVWLMVKRANRDLEISCDGEAVKEKDMEYRKAYGLMILHEAERGLQRQAALTTCFTDGKRALQERLVEIMNGKKRKKGMALVAMTLVLALTCGCLVSYGGSDPISEQTDIALVEGVRSMAETWAKALDTRDGKPRYEMMSEACKAAFIEEQKGALGDDWNYVIGWSSPWVISYEVEAKEGTAIITYTMQDSTPQIYIMKELLRFGEENGELVVINHYYSNIYEENGEIYPVRSKSGAELDEGIWDFMYQSVIGFYSESKWNIYEIERFDFDIQSVTTEKLDDTRERVTVDFGMKMSYRNPFRDPDEAGYIKRAKEAGHPYYEIFYKEYYQQQNIQENMRFVIDIQPDAMKIYEDTVYEETIMLYRQETNHPLISQDGKYVFAYEGDYDIDPAGAWYCSFQINPNTGSMAACRHIFIQDRTGRTNNGSFALPLGFAANVKVSEDSVILLGGPGEDQKRVSVEEWKKIIAEDMHGNNRFYTAVFKEREDGYYEVVEAREGHWNIAVDANTETDQGYVPSGYPTAGRTITAPFAMQDTLIRHTGIDITATGNLPVYATANGVVIEAEFDTVKGNYVKINHLNGFTTLYAHLADLEVEAGDTVEKGQILGRMGKTGQATGIHCHYEIQLNGIYQDPMDYL